ncbi:pectinesterase family protein [Novosphingobium sp. P6W]|uniref:pectinesterase family protein n=1 Tax=Novosphingobium sp. P6W TaxID=1609758 RepID=UPI0005C2B0BB|nr:pectinesterase family protein [Novosphingobium sp. P6W]AXB79084.1 pectin esterase [Novosphingobium sp. P6W]KIS30434.1 pectin esterase [Novosphingobium sp. P6W]
MKYLAFAAALLLPAAAQAAPNAYAVQPSCEASALPCYTAIQLALDAAARDTSSQWITIHVAPGDYAEKPVVTRDRLRLIGSGAARTRLHFGAVAQTAGHYHRAGWGTPGSATLTINAKDIVVSGITVENTYDYLANDRLSEPARIRNPQALALLLDIASDRVRLDHVALLGYQDTLFANGGRALVQRSLIAGNIDFIFGNGQLLIEDSEIRSRRRAEPYVAGEFQSFIAAPSTPLSQEHGIVVYRSRLTREAGVPDGAVALARPWHPTTRFADGRYADPNAVGQTSFVDCYMDRHIHRDHWTTMNGTARGGTPTLVFRPQDSRFFEAGSYGPGAKARKIGVSWKPASILQVRRDIAGWADVKVRH